MSEEIKYTKFHTLIKNNKFIKTDLIEPRDLTFLIKNIEFDELSIEQDDISEQNIKPPLSIINSMNKREKTIIFSNCKFNNELTFLRKLNYSFIFKECEFNNIIISNIEYDENYKLNFEFINTKSINTLTINNCDFSGKFYINEDKKNDDEFKIDSITINESKFNENFKLHNAKVETIQLNGVDFERNADFFKTKFGNYDEKEREILFKGINFNKLVVFEECEFYNKFIIRYATFESLVQFKEAIFQRGLDLDKTNILDEINFYGVTGLETISKDNNTSQETYRILKYNCEKIGNIIDANKYHALELQKRKEALDKIEGLTQEKIVFTINWYSSKFGTNWLFPLFWIFMVGFITFLLLHSSDICSFFNKPTLIDFLKYIGKGFNKVFSYMYILNRDKEFQDCSIVFLLNKIALGYLYYQFVTAVRKDTRK